MNYESVYGPQIICEPVNLTGVYKHAFTEPNAEDYPFLVPFYAKRHPNDNKIWTNIKRLSKHLNQPTPPPIVIDSPQPIEPYNPVPNMFIPEKYRNIIPKDPIYVNDRFIIPGSREWFTYMYNLEISIREKVEQEENEKLERFEREVAQSIKSGYEANRVRWKQYDLNRITLLEKEQEKERQEVMYYGTSVKHLKARKESIKSLTDSSNDFHNYIPDHLKKKKLLKDAGQKRQNINRNLKKFLKNHNLRHHLNFFDTIYDPLVVLDDTATLESRPNKRNMDNSRIFMSLNNDSPSKRSHPAPIEENDSVVAGPSNSK
ncbi:hypothetical protein GLOIN_2v1765013 [Rhizophagus irregularis DAOM 181602=DAOM 197198]|uniref:Uncharacterized protein n=1 Tax=Rhizophagus irregularis (strain DAOM 181602 / DAOM 197198 / MUCL 43194) TaxID=747089 RepID=A0A2P4NZP6_RHIID|nr:hypothetical protein GLOIN_2v1488460 [Rhizophagus irregularis DAOM 181602=DAOM 197198]XP_025186833.1 hypothetical protein GLOIN_2v1765013 [Rhizophagus irregularis DAOM 181602=DAOM 197198]POG58610.1 hypothetical protein GLOIN_2v1488460 [Rhizophagus irregularis DAOM 181602=DAOM 197198]POG79967.1 hypothetical protein GLOIN_2v1765013 [Rhizophagus irregularis DAOM 181602=DAOM 197198]CAG8680866.1 2577_t:CDS:2 [Rhizophagus irregularis]|eukprot:XP_025165476.1 hypothetical protein GLOIN_2v1488460 [Rhizophagus irregularis DAOM 181602=DAOM 197198]